MMLLMAGLMVVIAALSSGHMGHSMMEGPHGPTPGSHQSSGAAHDASTEPGTTAKKMPESSHESGDVKKADRPDA